MDKAATFTTSNGKTFNADDIYKAMGIAGSIVSWDSVCGLKSLTDYKIDTTDVSRELDWVVKAWDNSPRTDDDYVKYGDYYKMKGFNDMKFSELYGVTQVTQTAMKYNEIILSKDASIKEIKIYVPGKVMGVTINGHIYKQVVKEPDEFSMEFGCALALSKYLYGKVLTIEGVEQMAHKLLYLKCVQAEIRRAIKAYNNSERAKEKERKIDEEYKAIKERRRAKAKKKRDAKRLKMNGATITLTEADGTTYTTK